MKQIVQGIIILAALALPLLALSPQAAAAPFSFQSVPHASLALVADSASVKREVVRNLKIGWPWYVTRASGLVASALLALLILSGIGQITGLTYRIMEPLVAWRLHRALGIAFGVTVLIHVLPLLVDTFVPFNILQVLVPFMSPYMPLTVGGVQFGSMGVALGIISLYAAAIVLLSSFFWIDKKPFMWRLLHFLSYQLVVMVILHGLLIGTDLKAGILRWLWFGVSFIIGVGILSRLRRARTISRDKNRLQ